MMDPITAALVLANTIAEIVKVAIESQPPDVRAEYAKMQLEDYKRFRDFLLKFHPKTGNVALGDAFVNAHSSDDSTRRS